MKIVTVLVLLTMRRITILIFTLFFSAFAGAQINLVPNPGFDTIVSCPNNAGQVYKAPPWTDPTNATSDLINTCGSGNYCEAPNNDYGWQFPYNGDGFVGIATYTDSVCCANSREYIEAPLLSPLQAGKTYCVSFWVSWGDSSQYAIDGMGAYFSQNYISCSGCRFPYNPQVQNPAGHILNDGSQWEVIQGYFVAQGGEAYITIGNFKSDGASNVQLVDPTHYYIVSYYFVDNISVYEVAPCVAGIDAQICPGDSANLGISSIPGVIYSWSPTTALSDSTISNPVAKPQASTTYTLTQTQCNVSATSTVTITVKAEADCASPLIIPSILKGNEMLIISGIEAGTVLNVYDLHGRIVFRSEDYRDTFGAPFVATGDYVIVLTMPDGSQRKQKICVLK